MNTLMEISKAFLLLKIGLTWSNKVFLKRTLCCSPWCGFAKSAPCYGSLSCTMSIFAHKDSNLKRLNSQTQNFFIGDFFTWKTGLSDFMRWISDGHSINGLVEKKFLIQWKISKNHSNFRPVGSRPYIALTPTDPLRPVSPLNTHHQSSN